MRKPLLIALLIYAVSVIAFTVYFTGTRAAGPVTAQIPDPFRFFYGALRWALIPTALYVVYKFIVKRT